MRDWNGWVREQLSLPEMKGHHDERIISELADHLADLYSEAVDSGAGPEEAEALVVRVLGDREAATRELIRSEPAHLRKEADRRIERAEEAARRKGGGWSVVADGIRDLRLALRALGRKPVFSFIVILVLALGIGASTSIFTLLDAVVLSPLPFDDADRLIRISHTGQGAGRGDMGQTAAWHYTYEEENRVFEDLGMWWNGNAAITGSGAPEAVQLTVATGGVFRALRVSPVLGRSITPEDEDIAAPLIVLLSQGYWQSRFGEDPDVLGQTLQINGVTREIVGVMPSQLRSLGIGPGVIVPVQLDKSTLFVGNTGPRGVARLKDGVTLEQASTDISRMLPMAFEKFPGGPVIESMMASRLAPSLQTLKDWVVGSTANLLWILMAGVGAVLLIACANVANLFLVRAEGKEGEMAVRTAIGASRNRIGWEYLKESLLLGLIGGGAGLVLAQVGLRVLISAGSAQLPRLDEVFLNPTVLLFAVAISVGSGLFFGMFPVLRHRQKGVVDSLKQGRSSSMEGRGRNRTRNALAVSQMALALLLLVASGLMIRTSLALWRVDPGFQNPEEVMALRLSIPGADAPTTDELALAYETIVHRIEGMPGVESVALANSMPMDGWGNVNPLFREDQTEINTTPVGRRHKWIGEGYFETLQIPLRVGRAFTWHDIHERLPLAVVSESLAREYWGSPEAALGQRIAARPDPPQWYEIIGVAADVWEYGLGQEPPHVVYWPQVTLAFWQGNTLDQANTWRAMGLAVRSGRVGTADFLMGVREAIWSVNPNLPVRNMFSLQQLMSQSVARTSFSLTLLSIAAGVALLLGIIGVYGVISYAVSQRTSELGMRIALGAPAERVRGMVLRQGLMLSLVGVTIGLGLSLGLTRLMSGLLFGVSPVDPVVLGAVSTGLVVVALVASYLPARRAAGVDPMTALRAE
jgi:predicted permease